MGSRCFFSRRNRSGNCLGCQGNTRKVSCPAPLQSSPLSRMNAQKVLQRSKVALEAEALPDLVRGQHCSFNGLVSLVWRSQTSRYCFRALVEMGNELVCLDSRSIRSFLNVIRDANGGVADNAGAEGKNSVEISRSPRNYINFGTSSQLAGIMPQLVSITVEESRSHWMLRGKMRN